jgi:hypothetical protein
VPQDNRRWSSRHGTAGLSHPMTARTLMIMGF